jgi:AmiR/NasT family two-component response regulator
MKVLLLSADLNALERLAGAAAARGDTVSIVQESDALAANVAGGEIVFVDLATPRLDLAALVPLLRSSPRAVRAVVAFGPHVQRERLAAARAAGCDAVVSRGEFHASVEDLLAKLAGD